MASSIYNGTNLRFKLNNKKVLHATSCKLSISSKLEEIVTKDTNGTVSVPSNYSFGGSTDALLSNLPLNDTTHVTFDDLLQLQLNKEEIDVEFTTDVTGDIIYSGKAYIENAEITSEAGSSVKCSVSFKGNGDLERNVVS